MDVYISRLLVIVDGAFFSRLHYLKLDHNCLCSGSVLYQWNTVERAIVAKLDTSKIAPCSESINTINIEERARCQVTALCVLDRDDGAQLYIGTSWGVVIVTQADQVLYHLVQNI
jgi:hypothetical protein